MLTGKRGQKDVEKSILSGVNDYVVKPIVPNVLVDKINTLLQIKVDPNVLQSATVSVAASWQDTTKFIEVSELGFVLESNVTVTPGHPITLHTELYDQIGISILGLTVVDATADRSKPGHYRIQTIFTDIKDKDLAALQTWLQSNAVKKAS